MKVENINKYQKKLHIGHAIVVRRHGEGNEWIAHGNPINVDSRWSGGYHVDACVTGACMMIESVMVIFRRSSRSFLFLSINKERQKNLFIKKLMRSEG